MAEKYIIYTMGIKEINEAVQKVLFEKGYRWKWHDKGHPPAPSSWVKTKEIAIIDHDVYWNKKEDEEYQELTFRELCELPPVHDEGEELAETIFKVIHQFSLNHPTKETISYSFQEWCKNQDWCAIWGKLKPKLGL